MTGMWPGADTLSWDDDPMCRALVDAFPDGMTRAQVSAALGIPEGTLWRLEQVAIARAGEALWRK
jgi:DNA-binding transcriptional regulator LsrR (DeoR family)